MTAVDENIDCFESLVSHRHLSSALNPDDLVSGLYSICFCCSVAGSAFTFYSRILFNTFRRFFGLRLH